MLQLICKQGPPLSRRPKILGCEKVDQSGAIPHLHVVRPGEFKRILRKSTVRDDDGAVRSIVSSTSGDLLNSAGTNRLAPTFRLNDNSNAWSVEHQVCAEVAWSS